MYEFDHDRDLLLWPAVFLLLFFALLVLAMVQSQGLVTAAYDLPPSEISNALVARAENWHGNMQELGIAALSERIGEWVEFFHNAPVITENYEI